MSQVTIYTGHVNNRYTDALDITVKSGDGVGAVLAPTWALVCGHKAHNGDERFAGKYEPLTDEQYTEQYLALLRGRYRDNPQLFTEILMAHSRTLTCYCAPGAFCHRVIAATLVLPRVAERLGIVYWHGGEVSGTHVYWR